MQRPVRIVILLLALLLCVTACSGGAIAEQRARVMLAGASVADEGACSFLTVRFASKVRYVSHAPAAHGDELHIKLAHLDEKRDAVVDQESLHAPSSEQASVHAIELAYDASGAELSVYFKRDSAFRISGGEDGKSIVIAIAAAGSRETCDASKMAAAGKPRASEREQESSNERMDAIRKTVERGDIRRAEALIAEATASGDARYTQELEELSAMVLERSGRTADAAAAYRRYLMHYTKGSGADRVRARLAILEGAAAPRLNAEETGFVAPVPASPERPITDGAIAGGPAVGERSMAPGGAGSTSSADADPDAWTFSQNGSTSLFYYRNEGGRDVFVPPRLQLGWDKESVYKLYQNSVVGTLDYDARFQKGTVAGAMRVSTARDQDLISSADTENSVYTASLSLQDNASGVSGTIGRQTLYSNGVLGRFDGLVAGFQATDTMRVNAVIGSPVWRGADSPFAEPAYFYGGGISLDKFTAWDIPLEPGIYYFRQQSEGLTDREAIGGTLNVRGDTASLWALADYDIHYGALNDIALSSSYMFENRALASVNADYRRAPMIFTSNALQGQPVATLADLLKIYSQPQIEEFALDRTAHSFTLDVNYALPIGDDWQVTADAYLSRMSGTVESAGVPAMLATGTEYYGFLQVSRYNLFTEGDSQSIGVRYGDTQYDHLYALELSARYPITPEWSAGPVLRAGISDSKTAAIREHQFMPSLHLSYRINEQTTLDMEAGKKWIARDTEHGTEHETELMALAGVRYDFYTK